MDALEAFTKLGGWGFVISILALIAVYLCGRYNTRYLNFTKPLSGMQFASKTFIGTVGMYFSMFLMNRFFITANESSFVYYIIISVFSIASLAQLFVAGMGRLVDIGKLTPWLYPIYFIGAGMIVYYYNAFYPIYLIGMALLFMFEGKSED